jgi:multiple sugar transport system substrate-binding protein
MSSASRRTFLRLTVLLGAAGGSSVILAACGATTTPTTTAVPATSAPAAAPTEAPAATPTPAPAPTQAPAATATPAPAATAAGAAQSAAVRWAQSSLGEQRDAVQDQMAQGFQKAFPNVKFTVERRPYDQYFVKLQTEFVAGAAPDVSLMERNWSVPGAARGMLLDLTPFVTRDNINRDDYFAEVFSSYTWHGKYWGTYLYGIGEAYFANKALFDKAGVKLPAANWTVDDLLSLSKSLTTGDGPSKQYGLNYGYNAIWAGHATLIRNFGGKILNDQGNKAIWADDPKSIAATQWMVDTMYKSKVAPSPQAMQGQPNLFTSKRVAIEENGSFTMAQKIDGLKDDLAVLTTPTGGAGNFPFNASSSWAILSSTKVQDQAWELAKYIGLGAGQEIVLKMGIPGIKKLAYGPYLQQFPNLNLQPVLENFEKNGTYYVFTPDADAWWNASTQALGPMWSGEKSVPDAMRAAQDAVNAVFAQRPPELNG